MARAHCLTLETGDPREKAVETAGRYRITLKAGYGPDAGEGRVHAAGSITGAEARVVNAAYGSPSVGRLAAPDCLDRVGRPS
ncbi:MAG: hypothetical protein Kow0025_10500 [Thermodesulfovibrionales bacterium]